MAGDLLWPYVVASFRGNGANNATTFTDDRGLVWTAVGDAKLSTAQPGFGSASALFDGTGDSIQTPNRAEFALGAADFTIELRVRFNAVGASNQYLVGQSNSAGTDANTSFDILKTVSDKILARARNGSTVIGSCTGTTTVTTGVWYDIAYRRSGSVFELYINRSLEVNSVSALALNTSTDKLAIGSLGEYMTTPANAYIREFRMTAGYARTTGEMLPAASEYLPYYSAGGGSGDPYWPLVGVSIDPSGVNNTPLVFTEAKGNAFAAWSGNPVFSDSGAVTPTSALYFNGTAYLISTAGINNNLLNFGFRDFEINLWVYQTVRSSPNPATLLNFNTDSPARGWRLSINTNGTVTMISSGTGSLTTSGVIPLNTQTHLSVSRHLGVCYIRIGGVAQTITTNTLGTIINNPGQQLQISGALGNNWPYTGYMDRIEILGGVARHTADFTPETSAFLTYAGQVSGNVYDDTGAPCARTVRVYDRATGILTGSAVSDSLTGYFIADVQTAGLVTVVGLDDTGGVQYNLKVVDRVLPV